VALSESSRNVLIPNRESIVFSKRRQVLLLVLAPHSVPYQNRVASCAGYPQEATYYSLRPIARKKARTDFLN
jgi:hypothetical protein